ncbi:MAG: hypothetical protein MHM6MM_005029, partial [Cercozoa sp. M6MM]
MVLRTGLVFDERCLLHRVSDGQFEVSSGVGHHQESPERLRVLWQLLKAHKLTEKCERVRAPPVKLPQVLRVHDDDLVRAVYSLPRLLQTSSGVTLSKTPMNVDKSSATASADVGAAAATETDEDEKKDSVYRPWLPKEVVLSTDIPTPGQTRLLGHFASLNEATPPAELEQAPPRKFAAHITPTNDTFACGDSLLAARVAAGGTIELAMQVAEGKLRNGFAAVRPPGHHAEDGRIMGFCLFNNVAAAAAEVRVSVSVSVS